VDLRLHTPRKQRIGTREKDVDHEERPSVSQAIDHALQRLESVLTRLEGAVTQRFEAERDPSDLETELAIMGEDRARLAAELDAASARLAEVEATSANVEHRLGQAIDAVEGVLAPSRASR
jgi:chromosome segregation ATPase